MTTYENTEPNLSYLFYLIFSPLFTLVNQEPCQPTTESNPYQGFFRHQSLIKLKFKFNLRLVHSTSD